MLAGHQAELEAKMREEALAKVRAGGAGKAGPTTVADTPIAYRDPNQYPPSLRSNQVRLVLWYSVLTRRERTSDEQMRAWRLSDPPFVLVRPTLTARPRPCSCLSTVALFPFISAASAT